MLALVLVVGATTIDNHLFLSATNVQQILSGAAIIALLAIGETIVIITRNVDLSIGSVLGISAYATGVLYVHHPHVSLVRRLPASRSAIGVACGVVNGLIVTVARVPSLVVTLGTLYIIRGIDGAWAGGNQVNASMLPTSFNKIGYGTIARRPVPRDHRDRRRRDRHLRDAQLPHGARLLRDRLGSRRRAARRHPGRRGGCSSRSS